MFHHWEIWNKYLVKLPELFKNQLWESIFGGIIDLLGYHGHWTNQILPRSSHTYPFFKLWTFPWDMIMFGTKPF